MPRTEATDPSLFELGILPGAEWVENWQAVALPLASLRAAVSDLRLEASGLSATSRVVCTATAGVADRLVVVEPGGTPAFVAVPVALAPALSLPLPLSGGFSLQGVEWAVYGHGDVRTTLSRAAATRGPPREDIGGRAEWFSRRHRS